MGSTFSFTLPVGEESGSAFLNERNAEEEGTSEQGRERTRVLAVDDDPQTLQIVRDALVSIDFVPIVTVDPDAVPQLTVEHKPHLVLLDLVYPGSDGVEIMKNLSKIADLPIIFLSAYGHDEAIARALDAGATDYVVKPFSTTELVARIKAALRLWNTQTRSMTLESFEIGDLKIDFVSRKVTVKGNEVRLTEFEYRLLKELAVNAGKVLTYRKLFQRVWGKWDAQDTRPLRSIVKNLRGKLGDDARKPIYIHTVPRLGYRLEKAG